MRLRINRLLVFRYFKNAIFLLLNTKNGVITLPKQDASGYGT